ncbi:MAG: ATP-binding cassette domain-containing protein [Candidatus Micrarchaeales archaeon]|nr:ATP-binding cassette domain-containing protein [Candidatus Micrarchaeales archaeon]
MDIITVNGLTKKFGKFTAVDKISFQVKTGEIFGLLGPNGAGKTTTIKMLITLLAPTAGNATIAGANITKEKRKVRDSIGVVFQDPSLDDQLTGRENMRFHAILYRVDPSKREKRIQDMLKLVELEDKADMLVKNYSGGMKRRLEIGRGLLHDPKIMFLDEPTIGLDTQTRRHIWDYIAKLNKEHKTTIILTSHYIEEADFLCNRVAFIDRGKIVALDTPNSLKEKMGGDVIAVRIKGDAKASAKIFRRAKWIKSVSAHESLIEFTVEDGEKRIPEIVLLARNLGITVISVDLRKPSLEDVFIKYTGKSIREEEGSWKDALRMRHAAMSGGRR